jgi:hypothetical protein
MSERPHGSDDSGRLADLPPDDPRVLALDPRERARLRAYRDFVAPGDTPAGADLREAEERLGRVLERELALTSERAPGSGGGAAATLRRRGGAGGLLEALLHPHLRPAWAIAAAIIVVGALWFSPGTRREDEMPVLRGDPPVAMGIEVRIAPAPGASPGTGLRLEWTPAAEADHYAIEFMSPELVPLAEARDIPQTHFDLIRGSLPAGLNSGGSVLCRVVAFQGADEVGHSGALTLVVP